ncbi:DMT family transporter [Jeotgalibacillus soli]|uniref:Membrane protein n=1 Tax=Jeotgalibacillus soli TaxID=889306 RepID=A0A0C2VL16_9BACL|nr:DMT family transporter [Jeotgalibacillus soli]KIL49577.1 membrane protein [Jeotgalibacillus soli]
MSRLYGALIALSLIWGLSFVFIKWLVEPAGVWGTVFLRCMAGALILLPILWVKRKQIRRPIPWKALILVGIFNAGLPWGLIALSETQINSNTAAVLNALTPICTGLIGFLFFSIELSRRQWGGIIIGFAGILVLMEFSVSQLFSHGFVGVGTMILAALCYGFASQYTRKYVKDAGVLLITIYSLVVGGIVGLVGIWFSGPIHLTGTFDPLFILSVIGLGCFGSGIAHLLFYYMLTKGSPEFATTVTYLVPITAMIWGSVLLNESISANLAIGLMIIFFGVYIATKKPRKNARSVAYES